MYKPQDDPRTEFANYVCQLIWSNHSLRGEVQSIPLDIIEQAYLHFTGNVRNVYELVAYIPLFSYFEFIKFGADNWGYTSEQYQNELNKVINQCKNMYGNG